MFIRLDSIMYTEQFPCWVDKAELYPGSAAAAGKSLQSCPTLCDPIGGSPPGSTVPGILQARTLEWGAIFFSSAWKWKVRVKSLSRVWLFATPWTAAHQAPPSMGFSRQEYWSGVPFPPPVHESEKWKWSRSVVSDFSQPPGLQPTTFLCPWDFPGKKLSLLLPSSLLQFNLPFHLSLLGFYYI